MKLAADLDAYLEYLRRERQVSAHTLDGYRRDLAKLLAFCEAEDLYNWAALDTRSLRRLIARLHGQGLASRSLARLLSATRGLYRYLLREGLCRHDPAAGLSPPKRERRLPRTLDPDAAAVNRVFIHAGVQVMESVGQLQLVSIDRHRPVRRRHVVPALRQIT